MKVTEEERKIISWISNYFTKSSYKKMLVDLTNFDLESAFLCYLCKKTQQPIVAVICGENHERDEFCKLFKIQTIAVSLSSKDHIIKDCNGQTYQGFERDYKALIIKTICEANECMHVSSINKNRSNIFKDFSSLSCFKLMPFGKMDSVQFNKLSKPFTEEYKMVPRDDNFLDLPCFGGFSNRDIEWLHSMEERYKLITSDQDPSKNKMWLRFTFPQKNKIIDAFILEKKYRGNNYTEFEVYQ